MQRDSQKMIDEFPYRVVDVWSEILEPTPSGTRKFVSAWESLSNETRLRLLLERLSEKGPRYLEAMVLEKALECDSPYIRYVASRHLWRLSGPKAKELGSRARSDPDSLVRYALSETTIPIGDLFSERGAFLRLPHEERLAVVRELKGGGEAIANIVRDALGEEYHSKVSQLEIAEIVLDFLGSKNFKKHYGHERYKWDGWAEYQRRRDLEALWLLVTDVPDLVETALLQELPDFGELQLSHRQITGKFEQRHWSILFERAEIKLEEIRVEKFFECNEEEQKTSKSMSAFRMLCMMHNFYLLDDEFAEVLRLKDPLRKEVLTELADFGSELSLHMIEAVRDILSSYESVDYQYLWRSGRNFDERLRSLREEQRTNEIWKLRIYRLAKEVVQWRGAAPVTSTESDLKFLSEGVVEGDIWATFQSFYSSTQKQPEKGKKVLKWLQKFQQLGDEFSGEENVDVEEEPIEETGKKIAAQTSMESAPLNLVDARDVMQRRDGLELMILELEERVLHQMNIISDQRTRKRTLIAWIVAACAFVTLTSYFL